MTATALHVFCDFDGTITQPDTLQFLTGRFGGGAAHYRETGRLLHAGELTLREAVARDLGSIAVPFAVAARALAAEVVIDPGFRALRSWCAAETIPLTILSAGFVEIVETLLSPADLEGVEVLANRFAPGSWRCVFRDASPLGHDKAAALRAARADGKRTVLVGDGFSDRAPARVADLVFARRGRSLVPWCREQAIRCEEFDTLHDVQRRLAAWARTAA